MDITIQRELLLKPLQAINSVSEKKQTLPVLANVLLTIQNDQLYLTGTDLEIELIFVVKIESKIAEGSVTVSARKLFEICRTLPENSLLRFTLNKNSLQITAGECSFVLNTLPVADFPRLDNCDYLVEFNLKQKQLRDLLTKTHFAMAQQDLRHYLNGTFLDINQCVIKCVAADGHRLALTSLTTESVKDVSAQVILPRKSVAELIRLLAQEEDDQDLTLQISEGRVRLLAENNFFFTTKLINAQYPDYNKLIPRGTLIATGDREQIKQALVRASILSNEKSRGVRFHIDTDKLSITANNPDQEEAKDVVSLEYSGHKIELAFNIAYLLDAVSAMTAKTIRFILKTPSEGVLIESTENDQTLYVIMPMRL